MEAVQVAATPQNYAGSVYFMTLLARLEQVKSVRSLTWDGWSVAAGLSRGYLRTLCTRLRKGEDHGADHAARLARDAPPPRPRRSDALAPRWHPQRAGRRRPP